MCCRGGLGGSKRGPSKQTRQREGGCGQQRDTAAPGAAPGAPVVELGPQCGCEVTSSRFGCSSLSPILRRCERSPEADRGQVEQLGNWAADVARRVCFRAGQAAGDRVPLHCVAGHARFAHWPSWRVNLYPFAGTRLGVMILATSRELAKADHCLASVLCLSNSNLAGTATLPTPILAILSQRPANRRRRRCCCPSRPEHALHCPAEPPIRAARRHSNRPSRLGTRHPLAPRESCLNTRHPHEWKVRV